MGTRGPFLFTEARTLGTGEAGPFTGGRAMGTGAADLVVRIETALRTGQREEMRERRARAIVFSLPLPRIFADARLH
jgi:hypothetical protein